MISLDIRNMPVDRYFSLIDWCSENLNANEWSIYRYNYNDSLTFPARIEINDEEIATLIKIKFEL